MRIQHTLLVSLLSAHVMASVANAGPLKAGVARVDITPPLGLTMYGYGGRKAGATGVRDPLMAACWCSKRARRASPLSGSIWPSRPRLTG